MGDTLLREEGSVMEENGEEVRRKCKGKESRFGKRYGFELKLRCVKLRLEEGLPVSLLSKELGVSKDVVYHWVKAYQERGETGLRNPVRSSGNRRKLPGPVRKNALVPLCGVLLRGRIPREHPTPSRQWDLGACLPEPLRITTRGGLVLLDGQCPMGPLQPCRRLPARLSCRQLQSAQDPARARPRGGHPDHVANACPRTRTVPRGTVRGPYVGVN